MSEVVFTEELPGFKFEIYNGKPSFKVSEVNQVHGAVILKDDVENIAGSEADGVFSLNANTPMAIKTADCLPIAVIGKNGAALLHAGWRGVHQKIVQSSVLSQLDPEFFYIGPHIQQNDFEVQEDFKENFPGSHHFAEIEGKLTFNLGAQVSDQIKEVYPSAKIQISGISTFEDPRFHSYRLDGTKERNWNILSKLG